MRAFATVGAAHCNIPTCNLVQVAGSKADLIFILSLPTLPGAYNRAGQQDARQLKHVGPVAEADCTADLRANSQGTGFGLLMRIDIQF